MSRSGEDPLAIARGALERHDWKEALGILSEADRAGALTAEGLRLLAEAAWWSGEPEMVTEAAERAYGAYLREGSPRAAAMMGFELAQQYAIRMEGPLAGGWFARAERLVADDPDAPVHANLAWMRGYMALAINGDADAAIAHFDESQEAARRVGDRNAEIRSLHDKGRALCVQGRFAEGTALIDESMVAAVGGELDPQPTGIVYCSMIATCANRGDYLRAAEWTEATTRWCERNSITGFPGVCRIHRAEIMRLRGAWPIAEEEARRACDELPKFNLLNGLGYAYYEIGEVRRRMGDFAGAEAAFARAHEYGLEPQPGLSLVRLAQGKLDAAAAGVRRALGDQTTDLVSRARPLAAQAEIALAVDDLDTAVAASEELDAIARDVETTAMQAMAACVRGAVRLSSDDAEGALPHLRGALRNWQEIDAPYEAAEVRVLLGKAYRALDDQEGAFQELRAARDTFERLGATFAAEQTGHALGGLAGATEAPVRVQRAFLFTDIVKSTNLVEAIGDEAWEALLTWHDQTLRSLFASHGGEIANHTGDGFFVAFADARAALECAVTVDRALARHRHEHGFAPLVRMGVHVGDATRRGEDYTGGEVHKAARIAALAEGGEILASVEALAEVGDAFTASQPWEVTVKGLTEPIRVARVSWR